MMSHYGTGTWLKQVGVMTAKELRQLVRDRPLFAYVVYIFTLNIIIAAGGSSLELNRLPVLVADHDLTAASRELAHRFQPPSFALLGEAGHPEQAARSLDRDFARAVLDIPARFGEQLREGRTPATVQLLVDTSHANSGYLAAAYAERIAAGFGSAWSSQRLAQLGIASDELPRVESRTRIWFNPDLREAWFATLSELLGMMTVACILLPAAALVREKERGTIEQLLVAPVSPLQVMLAKLAAMMLVTLAGTAIALFLILKPVYAVPTRGSLPLFFALTGLYAFATAGLGLAAATFARNSAQMGMLVLLMVMPIITLSGTWTPLEAMPDWLSGLMTLSPMRHYIVIAYSILLRGAGLDVLWDSVLVMLVLGCALFALGLMRFRRQFG